MAMSQVVLKHETSTLRQRHTFGSIDFKFGVSKYVGEITNPAKFGEDPMRGQVSARVQHIRFLCLFFVFFFVFLFFNRATAHTRLPILAHNGSKDAVWRKEDPFRYEKCVLLKFGGVLP